MNEDIIKKLDAITTVMTHMDDLQFMDQLAVLGLIYELGAKMEKIAKANKIKIKHEDIDKDGFKILARYSMGDLFKNGEEQQTD